MIAGIDEAGRGPVLGPMVVAAVACEDPQCFVEMGVRDSKRLTPERRRRLARLIRDVPGIRIAVAEISAPDLDAARCTGTLNTIEVTMFQDVARQVAPRQLFLDAADVDAVRFGQQVAAGLPAWTDIVSEHHADDRYAVVGAASIIAKVRRDAAIDALRRRLERHIGMEMGSGYSHDVKTRAFLAAWLDAFGDFPEGTRRSWRTVDAMLEARRMPRLDTFGATTP